MTALLDMLASFETFHGIHPAAARDPDGIEAGNRKVTRLFEIALSDIPDDVLAAYLPAILGHRTFGWPKPSEVREVVLGRVVKLPRYATDCWGDRRRDSSGALVVERWHEVRVPSGWTGDPGKLEFGALPAEVVAHGKRLERIGVASPETPKELAG